MIVLITGPVRSGKSTRAVSIARSFGVPVTHVLTLRADPTDGEMANRIERHRRERGGEAAIELWKPGSPDLAATVAAARPDTTLLIDSLGTWIAGHLLDLEGLADHAPAMLPGRLDALAEPLLAALAQARCDVVVVAEETGWGLVPPSVLGRVFRDELGRLTQRLARVAGRVELVVAGYAIDLRAYGIAVTE